MQQDNCGLEAKTQTDEANFAAMTLLQHSLTVLGNGSAVGGGSYEHLVSLWDGSDGDFARGEKIRSEHKKAVGSSSNSLNMDPIIQFLGAFDSGNNLMISLLQEVSSFQQVSMWTGDGIWTHTPPFGQTAHLLQNISYAHDTLHMPLDETNAIVMVRSPFSLIRSWVKAPYNLNDCTRQGMTGQCSMTCIGDAASMPSNYTVVFERDFGCPWGVQGLIGAYNEYARGYIQLANFSKFKTVTLVSYEDLVLNPHLQLHQISLSVHGSLPVRGGSIDVMDDSAKDHGDAVGRAEAIEKLSSNSYLDEYNAVELEALCVGLDRAALQALDAATGSAGSRYDDEFSNVCGPFMNQIEAPGDIYSRLQETLVLAKGD